jgi:hypothetical protein
MTIHNHVDEWNTPAGRALKLSGGDFAGLTLLENKPTYINTTDPGGLADLRSQRPSFFRDVISGVFPTKANMALHRERRMESARKTPKKGS